jgi:hypothetical protein
MRGVQGSRCGALGHRRRRCRRRHRRRHHHHARRAPGQSSWRSRWKAPVQTNPPSSRPSARRPTREGGVPGLGNLTAMLALSCGSGATWAAAGHCQSKWTLPGAQGSPRTRSPHLSFAPPGQKPSPRCKQTVGCVSPVTTNTLKTV